MLITNMGSTPTFVSAVISQTDMAHNYFIIQIGFDGCVALQGSVQDSKRAKSSWKNQLC